MATVPNFSFVNLIMYEKPYQSESFDPGQTLFEMGKLTFTPTIDQTELVVFDIETLEQKFDTAAIHAELQLVSIASTNSLTRETKYWVLENSTDRHAPQRLGRYLLIERL